MKKDELFERAEKVRRDSLRLREQSEALRALRVLDRDFRVIRDKLARTMQFMAAAAPSTEAGLRDLFAEAEERLIPPKAGRSSSKNR